MLIWKTLSLSTCLVIHTFTERHDSNNVLIHDAAAVESSRMYFTNGSYGYDRFIHSWQQSLHFYSNHHLDDYHSSKRYSYNVIPTTLFTINFI